MFDIDFHRPRRVTVGWSSLHTGARLENEPPGPELGELLATVDPADLDMFELVSHLGAGERQAAWVQARQLAAVRELSGRRLVPGPHGEPADTAFPDATINEFAAAEVAAALGLSRTTGAQRVWLANALARLAGTEAAFRAAADQSLANLRRSLARAVTAADPAAAARRATTAYTERRVMLTPDGMCEFWALLAAPDAMALWSAITALADHARTADHARATGAASGTGEATGARRSMDQARADVLADLAYAVLERDDLPRPHRRRPHIQITMAASTALGLDDQPGELAGYGPITAQVARRVAADGTWRRLLTDPATGGLLDYGRTVYHPPANLAEHVITRDQTCRGLGCRIQAERCDRPQHPLPRGPTAAHNLACACRCCHIRKHQAGWTPTLHPNGDIDWTSPTGHRYHDPVPPILDTGPPARAPAHDTPPF